MAEQWPFKPLVEGSSPPALISVFVVVIVKANPVYDGNRWPVKNMILTGHCFYDQAELP